MLEYYCRTCKRILSSEDDADRHESIREHEIWAVLTNDVILPLQRDGSRIPLTPLQENSFEEIFEAPLK